MPRLRSTCDSGYSFGQTQYLASLWIRTFMLGSRLLVLGSWFLVLFNILTSDS